jgi:hypothetical protein
MLFNSRNTKCQIDSQPEDDDNRSECDKRQHNAQIVQRPDCATPRLSNAQIVQRPDCATPRLCNAQIVQRPDCAMPRLCNAQIVQRPDCATPRLCNAQIVQRPDCATWREMCDVTLKSADYSVQEHKVVLAAKSDLFRSHVLGPLGGEIRQWNNSSWVDTSWTESSCGVCVPWKDHNWLWEHCWYCVGDLSLPVSDSVRHLWGFHWQTYWWIKFLWSPKTCGNIWSTVSILLTKLAKFAVELYMPKSPMDDCTKCTFFNPLATEDF